MKTFEEAFLILVKSGQATPEVLQANFLDSKDQLAVEPFCEIIEGLAARTMAQMINHLLDKNEVFLDICTSLYAAFTLGKLTGIAMERE